MEYVHGSSKNGVFYLHELLLELVHNPCLFARGASRIAYHQVFPEVNRLLGHVLHTLPVKKKRGVSRRAYVRGSSILTCCRVLSLCLS